ncbi:uncharacterized protein LOC120505664 [Passer montanus]|uniref:uncharacterized protein LOC120505664 n=1 Tax=Passer montanus TaxID=9160 RepID=UPI001961BA5B|nr:uncharacterized protein LOC120505664 [Passer montanus]XP_039572347.1 uncharacterized protein LOC120505664 [Passer montanus]XP_039572350.1 uncharacterized protein LOC120505664 [Passer montanus]XP_039572351.1 uncharacterized protein LOC120505664 [Passer montanus]
MDSPHLLLLGFLLLALAAPHPSIAVSNAGPAKGTQGSTIMTVHYCKHCKGCTDEDGSINLENFSIIAEMPKKTNTIPAVELVTNKSHITVCFQQASSSLEGIYGIWDKTAPLKLWCGILNSGENGGGNFSTEDKKVCCEAEAIAWQHNPNLKCYVQKSHPKHTALPIALPGNPEFLTSKKNSLGTWLTFLFLGICAGCGATFYFSRLRRRQASRQERQASDREKLTHPR